MTQRKPEHLRQRGGRKPVPLEQLHRWTLFEIRSHCRVTLSDCWEWSFARPVSERERRTKQLHHAGKGYTVRQLAYLLMFGKLPEGGRQLSAAKCLNPRCSNPMHCKPVTLSEKCLLACARGTFVTPERCRNMALAKQALSGKVDMDKAREIRAIEGSAREHAPKYGISTSLFNRIRRGDAWKESGR